MAASTCDAIAFLDGDDWWHPHKLAKQVEALVAHPQSGLVACDVEQREGSRTIFAGTFSNMNPALTSTGTVVSGFYLQHLLNHNFIVTVTSVLIPRHVLDEVGMSDPTLPVGSDYDLYLRIALKYPFTLIREVLAYWRFLPTSASGPADLRVFRWSLDEVRTLLKNAPDAPAATAKVMSSCAHARAASLAVRVYRLAEQGRAPWARSYLFQLFLITRTNPTVMSHLAALAIPASLRPAAAFPARWLRKLLSRSATRE